MRPTWMPSLIGYPQTYTASDTGQANLYGQAAHWSSVPPPSPSTILSNPILSNPILSNPAPSIQLTGRLVTVYYRDPATGQDIALNVDETFYAIMLSINQQQVLTVYDAARPCWANPVTGNADFSLDEMTEAEKIIEEMKREAACA